MKPYARAVAEFAPAFAVALAILPFVIAHGTVWPWHPSTIDLQVYVVAVQDMLAGKDIYLTRSPWWNLPFIYPPIAAVAMVPLAVGPYWLWQVIWTGLLIAAQNLVLRRCGVRRGAVLALVSVGLVLVVEPIRTTLGYGQINTLLMALVVADLLPDRPGDPPRRIPRGALIGLAAAIKLTPALFAVFALAIGRRRVTWVAFGTFVGVTALGAIAQWGPTRQFYRGVLGGDIGAPAPTFLAGNQSISGAVTRIANSEDARFTLPALAVSALVALLAVFVAASWWRVGARAFALGLVGLATGLASPISWTHHLVWVVPLGVGVLLTRELPRWSRVLAGIWAFWVSAGLVLAILPEGNNFELGYTWAQDLVANLGPVLGVALIIGLAVQLVRRSLADPATDLRTDVPGMARTD